MKKNTPKKQRASVMGKILIPLFFLMWIFTTIRNYYRKAPELKMIPEYMIRWKRESVLRQRLRAQRKYSRMGSEARRLIDEHQSKTYRHN